MSEYHSYMGDHHPYRVPAPSSGPAERPHEARTSGMHPFRGSDSIRCGAWMPHAYCMYASTDFLAWTLM